LLANSRLEAGTAASACSTDLWVRVTRASAFTGRMAWTINIGLAVADRTGDLRWATVANRTLSDQSAENVLNDHWQLLRRGGHWAHRSEPPAQKTD
jgi:hypothetical protein